MYEKGEKKLLSSYESMLCNIVKKGAQFHSSYVKVKVIRYKLKAYVAC